MYSNIIDSLYENEGVEGVAVFNDHGDLVENQLALSEEAIMKIGVSLNRIRSGLMSASREMLGFLLKTDSHILQAIIHQEATILVQINPTFSVDQNYLSIKSQLGNNPIVPKPKPTPLEKHIYQPMQAAAAAETNQTAEDIHTQALADAEASAIANTETVVDWQDFRNSLARLIKRVAPSGVANKMITAASIEAGVLVDQEAVELKAAVSIGRNVVSKIPNATRRKLIEKEYDLMIKNYNL